MNNPDNLGLLRHAVQILAPVLDDIVLVGGIATALLITDEAADQVRPTSDIDLLIHVKTRSGYYQFSERLRALGFSEDTSEDAPMCRWRRFRAIIDVMTPDADVLGFTNRWYEQALQHTLKFTIDDLQVRVVDAPHFLATKLEAFKSRGEGDLIASHDMEDVLSVIDGRPELTTEIQAAPQDLQAYLKEEFTRILQDPNFEWWLEGFTPGHAPSRAEVLRQRMESWLR